MFRYFSYVSYSPFASDSAFRRPFRDERIFSTHSGGYAALHHRLISKALWGPFRAERVSKFRKVFSQMFLICLRMEYIPDLGDDGRQLIVGVEEMGADANPGARPEIDQYIPIAELFNDSARVGYLDDH
jgi:hypothetical protein